MEEDRLTKLNDVEIEDTFAECFDIWISRVLITATSPQWAMIAAQTATGFSTSMIMCPSEAAIEKMVSPNETPDGRPGVIIQICHTSKKKLRAQLLERIGQCILTCPTTAAFNALDDPEVEFKTGSNLRYFGDGFQKKATLNDRELWKIPVMEGEFLIERIFGAKKGIAGGNLILIGDSPENTLKAAESSVNAIKNIDFTITPFPGGICRSGSKVGSLKYPKLLASTNHIFCPTIKDLVPDTKLSENENCVLEIVINGLTVDAVSNAMANAIKEAVKTPGLIKITAANYEGKLGKHKIYLHKILEPK